MCGRFALFTPPARMARFFGATLSDDELPDASWNVAPTDAVLGVRLRSDGPSPARELGPFRWGLIPSWADDARSASRHCNARAETVAVTPAFRAAFDRRRLVVPADGFFEWHKAAGRSQPHYFSRADGAPLAFAGLWEPWRDPSSGVLTRSCTIITTEAGTDMDGIHDRMPVVLAPETVDAWLDPVAGKDELQGLLRPAPGGTLAHHPVGRSVGNVRATGPGLIEAAAAGEDPVQAALFDT